MSLTGELKYKNGQVRSAGSAATDVPITLTGDHLAILHDIGAGSGEWTGLCSDAAAGCFVPTFELCELTRTHREKYVHLKRSLLVRVKIVRNRELVELLCGCEEMSRSGLVLSIPCTLNFRPSVTCDLELFLTQDREPLRIHATVRSVNRMLGEDTVRFKVAVEFGKLIRVTQDEVDAYLRAASPDELVPVLA